eukprot:TRINITY_DN88386_c0_g1_i1.p1 TRINITY_DN88386_c0_g1~~TRINITY_DN88386_c0_g1_i1.p1  ORF type:complete len:405 (+),score=71.67 TRINITY_DN88386_c0_g1_i1:127-1341(+)
MALLLLWLASLLVDSGGGVPFASSREACRGLLHAAAAREDAELGLLCRSRLDQKECSAVLDSLGARPWSSTARESTCTRHGDLLAQRVLLQPDAGQHGYIVPLDSTANNKTTKAPGTEYAVPDTEGGKPLAPVAQSNTQAPATTRQVLTTTEESTTVKPSSTQDEFMTPRPSTSTEQLATPETRSSTEELTALKLSTTTGKPTTSIASAKDSPQDFPVPSSADASVQTVHDITGKPEQILMSSISDGSEPIMPTAADGTMESSFDGDSSAVDSFGMESDSTAQTSSNADTAAGKSSDSDVSSSLSSESDSSQDLASYDGYIPVQEKFQLPERLPHQHGINTAKARLAFAAASVSLVAGVSALALRSRWAERQYSRLDQPASGSESLSPLQLAMTPSADIESANE